MIRMNVLSSGSTGVLLTLGTIALHAGGTGLNVAVVVNQASSNSVALGNYYAEHRQVPAENVVRIHWRITMRQLSSSAVRLRDSSARSSFSPPSSAMLSPFSRRRVRA